MEKDAKIKGFIESLLKGPKNKWILDLYVRFWNPVNYAIVGGFGVIINYVVWAGLMIIGWPWFVINALAILAAWSWNWSNSVGPFGYLWGFQKNDKHNRAKS